MSEHSEPRAERASLSYAQLGPSDGRRVWVLHGIMGSKQNWSRFARRLSEARPELSITSIDLRCHGETPHISGPHGVEACARDLIALAERIGAPHAVIGHSFGGKVALQYAALNNDAELNTALDTELDTVWTLDSTLATRLAPGHGEVARVIQACGEIELPKPSRKDVTAYFTKRGFSMGIAQWMTTNLRRLTTDEELARGESGFVWRFDLEGIEALIADYWRVDGWALLREIPTSISLNLLRAERGLRWSDEDAARLEREVPHARSPLLLNSGHWVHIEQLEALIEMLKPL